MGVRVLLADGEEWVIPPRPVIGPVADVIVAGLEQLDALALEQAQLQADLGRMAESAGDLDAAVTRLLADDEATPGQLTAARQERDRELDQLRERGAELQRKARDLQQRSHLQAFAVIREAIRINYPDRSDEEMHRAVSVAHIGPLLRIVRGEAQLEDLYPPRRDGADPPTA